MGPGIIAGMRVLLASEPGGAGRPNEDFAAAVPGAVVLLDGAAIGEFPDESVRFTCP